MSEETHEIEVVTLVGGPINGERAVAPVGFIDIWMWSEDVRCYCRYARLSAGMRSMHFTGETKTMQAMAEMVKAELGVPWLHLEAEQPQERTVKLTEEPYWIEDHPHG